MDWKSDYLKGTAVEPKGGRKPRKLRLWPYALLALLLLVAWVLLNNTHILVMARI